MLYIKNINKGDKFFEHVGGGVELEFQAIEDSFVKELEEKDTENIGDLWAVKAIHTDPKLQSELEDNNEKFVLFTQRDKASHYGPKLSKEKEYS